MAVARRTRSRCPAFAQAFGEAGPGLPGGGAVAAMRRAAFDALHGRGHPDAAGPRPGSTRTSRKLANVPMGLAPKAAIGLDDLVGVTAGGPKARRLIFVNGHVLPELSHVESLPAGVRVMSLARALREMPERVEAVLAETEDDRSFTALNAAFAGAGAWIELADGAVLAEPVQLVYVTAGQPAAVDEPPAQRRAAGRGGAAAADREPRGARGRAVPDEPGRPNRPRRGGEPRARPAPAPARRRHPHRQGASSGWVPTRATGRPWPRSAGRWCATSTRCGSRGSGSSASSTAPTCRRAVSRSTT